MILQALCRYYQRKADLGEIAPFGFEYKEIPFIIVIDKEGNFVRIEDTREGEGKKKKGKVFLVPIAVKRTRAIKANLLWDTAEYVFGIGNKNDADEKKFAFLNKISESFSNKNEDINILIQFLKNSPLEKIEAKILSESDIQKIWNEEILQTNPNLSFKIAGDEKILPDKLAKEIEKLCSNNDTVSENAENSVCLITGEQCIPLKIHSSIKNVAGAQSAGAALISFNKKAFESYRKEQNLNAPVSEKAAFEYTTALNTLLKNSTNKIGIAETTTVFWAEEKNQFEDDFAAFFGYTKDDPDRDVKAVKNLFSGVYTGRNPEQMDTSFYVLGLSPNSARISIRFWLQGKISDFAKNLKQHFEDLEITRSENDKGHDSLFWILSALSQEDKVSNMPPNIAGSIVQAVLTGKPYPSTMLGQTLRRIRATHKVTRIRAAVLKAYLNRFNRFYKKTEKQIDMALDKENSNIGYCLGRLFATLEKIQEDANPGLNATIKDRFYGAASATPVTVFSQLLKLKNYHLAKIDNQGMKIKREQLLGEIFTKIPPSMPPHLTMEEQASFAIGYYHQRQDFFTKKTDN